MSLTNWHRETSPEKKPEFNTGDQAKLDKIRLQTRLAEEEDRTLMDNTAIRDLKTSIDYKDEVIERHAVSA